MTDEVQYIDFEKMGRVVGLVEASALAVANLDHPVRVDKPKPDPKAPCNIPQWRSVRASDGLPLIVAVPVVDVRVMRVAVRQRFVIVSVRMRLPMGVARSVGMLVMDVMGVRMRV